jgi:ribonuclease P protein component
MISSKNRFHGHGSLQHLFKRGKTVRGAAASLRYSASTRAEYRLAVVVSRKVSKSAVVRNRIRRRIYESVRILSTNFRGVYDISITVYDQKLATLPAAQLQAEVTTLLKKAGIVAPSAAQRDIVDTKE